MAEKEGRYVVFQGTTTGFLGVQYTTWRAVSAAADVSHRHIPDIVAAEGGIPGFYWVTQACSPDDAIEKVRTESTILRL